MSCTLIGKNFGANLTNSSVMSMTGSPPGDVARIGTSTITLPVNRRVTELFDSASPVERMSWFGWISARRSP